MCVCVCVWVRESAREIECESVHGVMCVCGGSMWGCMCGCRCGCVYVWVCGYVGMGCISVGV